MAYDNPKEGEVRTPRHSHYVSTTNNTIYPAMTNLPGYEDDNPSDWRPATPQEIDAYKQGRETIGLAPMESAVSLAAPVTRSAPTSLKLADEDPEPEAASAPAAVAIAVPVSADPAPVAIAPPPAPVF